jgi:hypothetical protein
VTGLVFFSFKKNHLCPSLDFSFVAMMQKNSPQKKKHYFPCNQIETNICAHLKVLYVKSHIINKKI